MSIPKFKGALSPRPFKVSIPQSDLDDLTTLIKLGRLPPPTYEGTQPAMGVTNTWMKDARTYWSDTFDWFVITHR